MAKHHLQKGQLLLYKGACLQFVINFTQKDVFVPSGWRVQLKVSRAVVHIMISSVGTLVQKNKTFLIIMRHQKTSVKKKCSFIVH